MSGVRLEFESAVTHRHLTWTADSVTLANDGILEVRRGDTLTMLGPGDHDGPVVIVGVR